MRLQNVRADIAAACREAGRDPQSVTLVAVSKARSSEEIRALLQQGQRVFGESRVQEAEQKFIPLRAEFPGIALHCIGHLQTNKVREAVGLFDVIGSVDSRRLAAALGAEMERQKRPLPCFIQVNTGAEAQKGGVAPGETESLLRFCREEAGLNIVGLMCIPPQDEPPALHFALLRDLAARLGLPELSMGMSADFAAAIRYGATHVRIGRALFEG